MIAIRLEGRLGNQLFQYAFVYAASKRLNTAFYLDKSIDNFVLPQYFDVKNDFLEILDNRLFSINGYKNVFRIHIKKGLYRLLHKVLFLGNKIIIANQTPTKETFKQFKDNYMYEGFFQSESYFEDFKDEIKTLYKIKKPYIDDFEKIKKQLKGTKKKVVIHVRRTDYVDLDISLPIAYYKKAIATINDNDIEYIFISDDPAFIEKEFSYITNKYISNHNEIIDLQFLINADICILSNSSFSWWGAWLNNRPNKQVFVPKYWLGFKEKKEYPFGIFENLSVNQIQV